MSNRPRTLVDWLLVRAWMEPGHERPLRVSIRRPGAGGGDGRETERLFDDADGAASFVRLWLMGLMRRWESGERFTPQRRWGSEAGPEETGSERES